MREGIEISEAITGDGAAIFRHACRFGPGGHRLEADWVALRERSDASIAEDEKPEFRPGGEAMRVRKGALWV
jgi:hypothetical protein